MVLVTLMSSNQALADPITVPAPEATPVSDVQRARESIDYLMATYQVSQDEALRRLRLQERADDLVDAVRASVGEELLDFRIDQKDGGKFVFLTSKPDIASRALASVGGGSADAEVVRSKHSAAELEAARSAVAKRLSDKPAVEVWTDPATETIRVRYSGTDRRTASQVRTSAGRVAGDDDVVVAVDTSGPPPRGEQKFCDSPLSCGQGAAGGMRMHIRRDDGTWGSCTAGFNVRGSNGWVYLLTAGHCVEGKHKKKRQYAYHAGLPLVWEKARDGFDEHDPTAPTDSRYFKNDPGGNFLDYALLPYQTDGMNWSSYWSNGRTAHNHVVSQCVNPFADGCVGGNFGITDVVRDWESVPVGAVLCATGTGTGVLYPENVGYTHGTRCGIVQNKTMNDYSNEGGGRGIKVDICGRPGDSGGPLFSQLRGRAYGILSGGPPESGPCRTNGPPEYGVYSLVTDALADLKERTDITFNIITTVNG
ncbi:S1 family peptidase [Couchioplanes caeruleus]|nr:S1 family peptidase [Couchioplanes caeruleus]